MGDAWGGAWGLAWGDAWGAAQRTIHEVEIGFSRKLWWQRKPRKEREEDADEKLHAVVRAVSKVAQKHVGKELPKKERVAEIRAAVPELPGLDVVAIYDELLRRVLEQARLSEQRMTWEMQRAAIARAVQEEEDIELLLMSI